MITTEERVLQNIEDRRDEIIEFLRKLISFPSVTGDERKIQGFIVQKLGKMGLTIDMWEPDQEELKRAYDLGTSLG